MSGARDRLLDESRRAAREAVAALAGALRAPPPPAAGDEQVLAALVALARRLLAQDAGALASVLAGRGIALPTPGGHVFCDLGDWTTLAMLEQRGWERPLAELCRRFLPAAGVAVDAGAHTGVHTVLLAAITGRGGVVHAFEPAAANRELLRRSVAASGHDEVVVVHAAALADRDGRAPLWTYRGPSPDPRLSGRSGMLRSLVAVDGYGDEAGEEVSVITLDGFAAARGLAAIDFLKIDVEGAELALLRGARELVARSPGLSVIVELHPAELQAQGSSGAEVAAALHRAGLAVFGVEPAGDALRMRPHRDGDEPAASHLFATRRRGRP